MNCVVCGDCADCSATVERLQSENTKLREALEKFRTAANDFVTKVRKGEAKSIRSYAKFVEALNHSDALANTAGIGEGDANVR